MKFVDLFSGIGGFHQVLRELGHECVLACDIDKHCRKIYLENYGIEPHPDVKSLDETNLPEFDILTGGFPCQPFSIGGKKLSFDDNRGLLFDEIIRIANIRRPKFMFLENVKHIMKVSSGAVIKYIRKQLDNNGYYLQLFQMSPHKYGIPQQRERIYFVCINKDCFEDKPINLIVDKLNLRPVDVLDRKVDEKYNIKPELHKVLDSWNKFIKIFDEGERVGTVYINDCFAEYTLEEFEKIPSYKQVIIKRNKVLIDKYRGKITNWYNENKEIINSKKCYSILEWSAGVIKKNDNIYNYIINIRQSGIRVKKNEYFPTLVAVSNISVYGKYKRYLTPRECMRLQSFPDTFKIDVNDRNAYKQAGNAVNVYNVGTVIKSTFKTYNIN